MTDDTKEPLIAPTPLGHDLDVDEEAETYVDDRPMDLFEVSGYAETDILSAWSHHSDLVPGPNVTHSLHGKATHRLEPGMLDVLNDPSISLESYAQKDVLGEGGMGIVYLAKQHIPPREVAVKRLRFPSKEGAEQLFAEALLTGSLEHPNIIPVHSIELGRPHGPEVVLKKVEGQSLVQLCEDGIGDEQVLRRALGALIQVCHALEYAHSLGVYHRDVKADNIMLGQYGEVYLLDWGIALDTRKAQLARRGTVGTPQGIAPEMVSGDPNLVDARTDVYLLGSTLHFLLVGTPRHQAPTTISALVKASQSEPHVYGPEVYPELGALANAACSAKPEDRPQSAEAFRLAIESCLVHWDAVKQMLRAKPDIEKVMSTDAALSFAQRMNHYERALSQLETSLIAWPEFSGAREARWALRVAMLKASVEGSEAQIAAVIHRHLMDEYPERTDEVEELGGLVSAAQELETLAYERATENDITLSGPARTRIASAMLLVVTVVSGLMGYVEYFRTEPRTAFEGLVVWGGGCLLILLFALPMRKKIMANAAGQRALLALAMAPLLILLMRVVMYTRRLDPADHYSIECFVLGFACVAAVESFPRGPKFGLAAMGLGILALLVPDFGYAALISSLLLCSTGIVWQWSHAGPERKVS